MNVLVTSVGNKVPLIKALQAATKRISRDIKVIGCDLSPLAIAKHFADDFITMPSLDELNNELLLTLCKENQVDVIIPTRDGELEFFSSRRSWLEQNGIKMLISSPVSIKKFQDKLKFYQLCKNKNIDAIPTYECIDEVFCQAVVVKEKVGSGSIGVAINLTKSEAIAHAKTLESPIYQPYIEGEEISIDSWCDNAGVFKGCILRYRNLVINGESQITTTFRNQEIEDKIEVIINKLEIKGHAVLQAIIDREGNIHLIEINARFGGASTASIAAGLDTFYWTLCELYKRSIPDFKRSEKDITQVRYSQDMLANDNNF